VPMAKFSAPRPSLPTATADSGLEQAAKMGGWGDCTGLGTIWVGAILKKRPS